MNDPQTELKSPPDQTPPNAGFRYWKMGSACVSGGLAFMAFGKDLFRDKSGFVDYDLMLAVIGPFVVIPVLFLIWKVIRS